MTIRKPLALITLLLPLLLLTACGQQTPAPPANTPEPAAFYGKIMSISDNLLLLTDTEQPEGSGLYTADIDGLALTDAAGQEMAADALAPGMLVTVGYSGQIQETLPATLAQPATLQVTGQTDDLVGFYLSVIDDLCAVDTGLNSGISLLAFDLNAITNLSAAEKSALLYLAQNTYGLETMAATYDELCQQGLIDQEKLHFETGLLIAFGEMDFQTDRFTFSVSKWRGGLGAYFFTDCKAVKTDGQWAYTIGAEAIA